MIFQAIDKSVNIPAPLLDGIELHLGDEAFLSFYTPGGRQVSFNLDAIIQEHGEDSIIGSGLRQWIDSQRQKVQA